MPLPFQPYIPDYITVHLGTPESDAGNVTVSFPDYIKNVASSEIYPTWNEAAIYANIYAQISYAVNRVYTEFYRSRGYNFNITSSTAYDQKYIQGRNIFDNIERIVDEIFTTYIRRQGNIEPLAAKYCNGTTVTCEGLSQWGSQELASQGYTAFGILQNYYGNDIELVYNAPISNITRLYPGSPVSRGDSGTSVTVIQEELNEISRDYPAIPRIDVVDGIFGENTENAVIAFQRIFNLNPDGIVGTGTWNKMVYLYVGIKRLAELDSEGQQLLGSSLEYPDAIKLGDTGTKVSNLQYFLSVIAQFNEEVPAVEITGSFGEETLNSVREFQKAYELTITGVVGKETWDTIYDAYVGIINTVLIQAVARSGLLQPQQYPGRVLFPGNQDTVQKGA